MVYLSSLNAVTIGSTLSHCKAVAALFRNTCATAPESPANWDASFTSETIECGNQVTCADSSSTPCQWERKLCVTCYQNTSGVFMRVQTNGLPDHCFNTVDPVRSNGIDFFVRYNPSMIMENGT